MTDGSTCAFPLYLNQGGYHSTGVVLSAGQQLSVWADGVGTFDGANGVTPDGAIDAIYAGGGPGWVPASALALGKIPFSLVIAVASSPPGFGSSGSNIFQGGSAPVTVSSASGGTVYIGCNDVNGAAGDNTGAFCVHWAVVNAALPLKRIAQPYRIPPARRIRYGR